MTNSYLSHHGILGQKWGIRRYQPYPKGKHGTFLGQSRDEDIRIRKGAPAHRIQKNKKISGTGQMYVSFDTLDNLKYASAAATGNGVAIDMYTNDNDKKPKVYKWNDEVHGYSIKMILSEDLIIPSYQKTMDAFINTMKNVGVKEIANQLKENTSPIIAESFIKNQAHLNEDDARDNAYILFCSQMMRDTTSKKEFFDQLKKEGYNAIIDEWDNRFNKNGFSNTPVIMFDKSMLKQTKSTKLTGKDMVFLSKLCKNPQAVRMSAKAYGMRIKDYTDTAKVYMRIWEEARPNEEKTAFLKEVEDFINKNKDQKIK